MTAQAFDWAGLPGLPLEEALARLEAAGVPTPRVQWTEDPRHPRAEGTARVVRAVPGALTAARFLDGWPGAGAPGEEAD